MFSAKSIFPFLRTVNALMGKNRLLSHYISAVTRKKGYALTSRVDCLGESDDNSVLSMVIRIMGATS